MNRRNILKNETITNVLIFIAAIIYVLLPIIIFGTSELDNDMKDFSLISVINLLIVVIPLYIFKKFIKLKPGIDLIIIVICIIQFSILPQIFYKTYKENPDSYAFENKFIRYIKKENNKKITTNDFLLLKNQHYFDSLLTKSKSFETLPRDRDTLIILDEKTIVLCPSEKVIQGAGGLVDCTLSIYDAKRGVELFSFPKKGKSIFSSYKMHKQNLKINTTFIITPEIGINYFDFWLSSVSGFNTSEIIPISTFTRILSKIVLGLTILILGLILGQLNIFEILKKRKQGQA